MAPVPAMRAGAILAVSDITASLSFYRDRLGLDVVATHDDPPTRRSFLRARGCRSPSKAIRPRTVPT